MHELSLEQMIKLSVFHLNGFNHYVTQLDSSGFDLYLNSHKMVTGIFNQELKQDNNFLKSIDFAGQSTVANLSMIHSPVSDVNDVEKLRNSDFTVNQLELMGLTQLK